MQIFTVDNNEDIKELCKKNKIRIKDIRPYQFVCEYYETRNSWGHKGKVLYNNNDCIGITHRIRYYNRTWECYTYQSLLLDMVNKVIKRIKKDMEV